MDINELKAKAAEMDKAAEGAVTKCLEHAIASLNHAIPHLTNGQLSAVRTARRAIAEIVTARGGNCEADPTTIPVTADASV